MANWNGLQLTNKGIALQAKVQAGTQLHITKLKLGSGVVPSGTDVKTLTDLIAPEQNLGIGGKEAVDDYCKISSTILNTGLEAGYYVRELGVFAQDPDDGEILYMYTTDGAPDYLPAGGGSTVISQEFSVMIAVDDTDNIVVDIDSAALATMGYVQLQIQQHDNNVDAHEAAFNAHNAADDAHKDFTGATAEAAGKRGMVPAPAKGNNNRYLKSDATWGEIDTMQGATSSAAGAAGLVPAPAAGENDEFLRGDGTWQPINTMKGASASAAGAAGLVPAPAKGDQNKALFGDATYKQVVQKVNGVAPDSGGNVNVDMSGYLPLSGGTLTGSLTMQTNNNYGQINFKTTNNRERRLDISDTHLRLAVMTDKDVDIGGRYLVIDTNSSLAYAFYVQEQISGDWSTYYLFGQHNIASQAQAEAGTNNTSPMTPLRTGQAIKALALPKGTILPFAGRTVPSGFLACNGAAVSRTTYAALFSAIGTTYGSGDGSTTFNLPLAEDNRFLEFASTAGTKKNAGLPNIQGRATFRVGDAGSYVSILRSGDGAFTVERDGATQIFKTDSVDADVFSVLAINASRSSSIYGASTTVQPKSLTVRAIIKY